MRGGKATVGKTLRLSPDAAQTLEELSFKLRMTQAEIIEAAVRLFGSRYESAERSGVPIDAAAILEDSSNAVGCDRH